MKPLKLVPFLFLSLPLSGLTAIPEPTTLWDKNKINVCFLDDQNQVTLIGMQNNPKSFKDNGFTPQSFTTQEKTIIKNTVNESYTEKKTGIHFVGWENCSRASEIDVVLMKAGKIERKFWLDKSVFFDGAASIGENGVFNKDGYFGKDLKDKAFVALTKDLEKAVINHEFGHIAGLRHEHIHPQAKRIDSSCSAALYMKEIPIDKTMLQSYDRASIMNYCRIHNPMNNSSALSAQDSNTLKMLYGNKR